MGGGIDIIMNGNGDAFELTQGLKFVVSNCLCVLVGVRDGVGVCRLNSFAPGCIRFVRVLCVYILSALSQLRKKHAPTLNFEIQV